MPMFGNRKMEVRFVKDSEEHIRPVKPKATETSEQATDETAAKVVAAGAILIRTYFVWKIADRVVEKILR